MESKPYTVKLNVNNRKKYIELLIKKYIIL